MPSRVYSQALCLATESLLEYLRTTFATYITCHTRTDETFSHIAYILEGDQNTDASQR